jgi:6-phospho-beta-glucosidase
VVEISADIDRDTITPVPSAPLPDPVDGLVRSVKAYERAAIEAALSGDWLTARKAMLIHPAIGEWSPSEELLQGLFGHAGNEGDDECLCHGPASWHRHG